MICFKDLLSKMTAMYSHLLLPVMPKLGFVTYFLDLHVFDFDINLTLVIWKGTVCIRGKNLEDKKNGGLLTHSSYNESVRATDNCLHMWPYM